MFIKLKIKNKNIELSVEEAEKLFDQLNQVFGKTPPAPFNPWYPNYPIQPLEPMSPAYPTWPKFWYSDDAKLTS